MSLLKRKRRIIEGQTEPSQTTNSMIKVCLCSISLIQIGILKIMKQLKKMKKSKKSLHEISTHLHNQKPLSEGIIMIPCFLKATDLQKTFLKRKYLSKLLRINYKKKK
jgi:hypothetical protein